MFLTHGASIVFSGDNFFSFFLDFFVTLLPALPQISFCPPKGTNTALNYDLYKLRNTSLTAEQKKTLKEAILKHFRTGGPQMDFVNTRVALANRENLGQIYAGYQSYPTTDGNNTEIQFSSPSGRIHTPGFHKDDDRQKIQGRIAYTLNFPGVQMVPSSFTLVLKIEADLNLEEKLMISGGDLGPPESSKPV